VDENIDRILNLLDSLEISEHTLVFLTSDNGGHNEGGHDHNFFGSNAPLRGRKSLLYEGGVRVPGIARWPGRIQAGSVTGHQAGGWDFMATAAEVAGVDLPSGDGISFLPALLGKQQQEHPYLYWENHWLGGDWHNALRMGKWKAVQPGQNSAVELYDLSADIDESNDISGQHPDIMAVMDSIMEAASEESPYYPLP
jgi:arylsulfatase A-like enzyme